MPTYIRRPGDMEPWDIPGVLSPATIVGTNPVLADDDDSTYVEIVDSADSIDFQQWAIGPLDGSAGGTITDITADIRLHDVSPATDGSSVELLVQLWDAPHAAAVQFVLTVDKNGGSSDASSPRWFMGVAPTAGSVDGMDLSGGGEVRILGNTTGLYVGSPLSRVLEVVFHITATVGGLTPPCQLYPRDDDQGVGNAAIWPPPSSGRPGSYY